MTPLLVGPGSGLFAMEARPSDARSRGDLAAIVAVHRTVSDNPVGIRLARRLSSEGFHVICLDHPGHGWSLEAKLALEEAIGACASYLTTLGIGRIGLVVAADTLDRAVRYGQLDERVVGVASAALPAPPRDLEPDQINLGALRRRGLGEAASLVKDHERRKRFFGALWRKIRRAGPGSTLPGLKRGDDAGLLEVLHKAAESGLHVLVVGGWKDKTSRLMRNLGETPLARGLTVDLGFEGRMADFDTIASQVAFTDSVVRWFGRLVSDS